MDPILLLWGTPFGLRNKSVILALLPSNKVIFLYRNWILRTAILLATIGDGGEKMLYWTLFSPIFCQLQSGNFSPIPLKLPSSGLSQSFLPNLYLGNLFLCCRNWRNFHEISLGSLFTMFPSVSWHFDFFSGWLPEGFFLGNFDEISLKSQFSSVPAFSITFGIYLDHWTIELVFGLVWWRLANNSMSLDFLAHSAISTTIFSPVIWITISNWNFNLQWKFKTPEYSGKIAVFEVYLIKFYIRISN